MVYIKFISILSFSNLRQHLHYLWLEILKREKKTKQNIHTYINTLAHVDV